MTLTKALIAERLAERYSMTLDKAKELTDFIFSQVSDELIQGGKVMLSQFGTFEAELKHERIKKSFEGKIVVPDKYKVTFTVSREYKNKLIINECDKKSSIDKLLDVLKNNFDS